MSEDQSGASSARAETIDEALQRDVDFSGEPSFGGSSEQVAALTNEVAELKDKYLRSLAELENIQRRHLKERSELLRYQGQGFIGDLLEIVDAFDRAIGFIDSDGGDFRSGVVMIHKMLGDLLSKHQVTGESAVGSPFDPNKHEALSQMPSADVPQGVVMSELRKAYYYKDKLLRVGQVVISSGAPAAGVNPV